MNWWLPHILGIDNETGPWYAFWSGFGSDVGELAIIGGLIGLVRKHTCHVRGCPRLGRFKVDGTAWVVCARHHPDGAPTAAMVLNRDGE
jgi:hypothetical protein